MHFFMQSNLKSKLTSLKNDDTWKCRLQMNNNLFIYFHVQFEILGHLQKSKKPFQMDPLPQLRLSPPVIYHETVNRSANLRGQSSNSSTVKGERSKRLWQIKDLKSKGFKTNLFGEFVLSKLYISNIDSFIVLFCSLMICCEITWSLIKIKFRNCTVCLNFTIDTSIYYLFIVGFLNCVCTGSEKSKTRWLDIWLLTYHCLMLFCLCTVGFVLFR